MAGWDVGKWQKSGAKMMPKWSPLSGEWHRMSQSARKRQKMAEKRRENGEKTAKKYAAVRGMAQDDGK
jgi:hypothetical protein